MVNGCCYPRTRSDLGVLQSLSFSQSLFLVSSVLILHSPWPILARCATLRPSAGRPFTSRRDEMKGKPETVRAKVGFWFRICPLVCRGWVQGKSPNNDTTSSCPRLSTRCTPTKCLRVRVHFLYGRALSLPSLASWCSIQAVRYRAVTTTSVHEGVHVEVHTSCLLRSKHRQSINRRPDGDGTLVQGRVNHRAWWPTSHQFGTVCSVCLW